MLQLARRLGLLLRLVLAPLLLVLFALPAFAGEAEDKAALDQLFAQLRVAPDAETAQEIWNGILHWHDTSGEPFHVA